MDDMDENSTYTSIVSFMYTFLHGGSGLMSFPERTG